MKKKFFSDKLVRLGISFKNRNTNNKSLGSTSVYSEVVPDIYAAWYGSLLSLHLATVQSVPKPAVLELELHSMQYTSYSY